MRRRDVAAGIFAVGSGIVRPARARTNDRRVLRYVPQANLTVLDPIWTTAQVTLAHGFHVFDTLYGTDDMQRVRPQMAEGDGVSDDGRTWTIRLRDGLKWHDGTPVLARDCASSLERWSKRNIFGQLLANSVERWGATDDRTIRITLNRPFPRFREALATVSGTPAFMMPERLARTDAFRQVTEMVGSGPYRFLPDEFDSGSRVAYARFEGYRPRAEPAEGSTGGKLARFERIEWKVIADSATAAAALQAGEVDWWDQVNPDLIPLLRRSQDITLAINDSAGAVGTLRFNCLQPPFDNVEMRRAVLLAVNQDDYLRAITGNDPRSFAECRSMWPCGTTYGRETLPAGGDLDGARAALRRAGYSGGKVVVINPSDLPSIGPFGHVTVDLLRRLGMNVELIETDWGSVVQRRANKGPVDKGGWSIFHTWWPCQGIANPATNPTLRGQGERGWFGWYSNDRVEQLTRDWLESARPEDQLRAAEEIQQESMRDVPIVPLGRYYIHTAYRSDLRGFLKNSISLPWNVYRV